MNESNKKNFILTAPINRVIFTISAPLILNNLVMTMYNLVDGLFVAQISAEDFAATAFIWPLHFLFISVGMGIGIGGTALLSQFIGAERFSTTKKYASNILSIVVVLAFVLSIFGFWAAPTILKWMGASGVLYDKSLIYLRINLIGVFFDFIYFAYQAMLNSQGLTKHITKISISSSLMNIFLDALLILPTIPLIGIPGANLGLVGAAWATVASKILLLILAIIFVKKYSAVSMTIDRNDWDGKIISRVFQISIPSALGYSGSALGFTVLNGLITSYGTNTLAAYSMVNRVTNLLDQPQMAIGGALTSIIGQHMGAGMFERGKAVFHRAIFIVTIMSVFSSVIAIVFRYPLLSIFIADSSNLDLWTQALEYLYFSAFIIFFMGLFSITNGFFQGMGQTQYSMLMTMGRLWFIRLPLIWLLSRYTDLGSTGIWIAMLLSNALTVIWGFIIYRTKDWEYIASNNMNKSSLN